MIKLFFETDHRVLMAQVSGICSSQDIVELDQAVIHFLAQHERAQDAPIRAIYDFSRVDALAIPESRIVERRHHPAIVHGKRVLVVRNARESGHARAFAEEQKIAGYDEPAIVGSFGEACALLRLDHPRFDPIEQPVG